MVVLRSDSEHPIIDFKRHAAAEFRLKHGMTVLTEDSKNSRQLPC